jgi:hypothetical protein
MNAYQKRSTYAARPKLPKWLTPLFWGGSLVFGGVIVAVLYCMLTREIPI